MRKNYLYLCYFCLPQNKFTLDGDYVKTLYILYNDYDQAVFKAAAALEGSADKIIVPFFGIKSVSFMKEDSSQVIRSIKIE